MPLHLQELGHLISFCELKIEYVVESIVFTSKFGMKNSEYYRNLGRFLVWTKNPSNDLIKFYS